MRNESAIEPVIGAKWRNGPTDRAIAAVAERQHGVAARAQLLELGIGRRAIGQRLECGRLHPLHSGVYAVGHRLLTKEGWWMAAVLGAGPDAVLSHRSAAALWQIRATAQTRAEVTTPRKLRPRPGLLPHCTVLPADEITTTNGIRVTTPTRTLLDLAGVVDRHTLERALNEAEVRRLGSALSPADLLGRYPGRQGSAALRRLLDHHDPTFTRSELENRFITFLNDAVLPRPAVNTRIEGIEVDFAWPAHKLIAELDGFANHSSRRAFERDRARDRRLQAAGWRVVRVTWRQLHDDPLALERELRALDHMDVDVRSWR